MLEDIYTKLENDFYLEYEILKKFESVADSNSSDELQAEFLAF